MLQTCYNMPPLITNIGLGFYSNSKEACLVESKVNFTQRHLFVSFSSRSSKLKQKYVKFVQPLFSCLKSACVCNFLFIFFNKLCLVKSFNSLRPVPEWGTLGGDVWPLTPLSTAILMHQQANWRSSLLFLSISIIGLSCIHLSVDALWYEVAGCRGIEAFPLRVSYLPISLLLFLLLSAMILF